MATPSQILANRTNAQLSTGPTTEAGKSASSVNALRHGAYSKNLFFTSPEEKAEFESFLSGFVRSHSPADEREYDCVFDFAHARWLLLEAQLEESQTLAHLRTRLSKELKKQGLDPAQHLAARVLEVRNTDKNLRAVHSRLRHLRTHANRALRNLETYKAERRRNEAAERAKLQAAQRAQRDQELRRKNPEMMAEFDQLLSDFDLSFGFVPAAGSYLPEPDPETER